MSGDKVTTDGGWIGTLMQLVSTINYSAIANSNNLLLSMAHTKSSMFSLPLLDNGSSASVLVGWRQSHNSLYSLRVLAARELHSGSRLYRSAHGLQARAQDLLPVDALPPVACRLTADSSWLLYKAPARTEQKAVTLLVWVTWCHVFQCCVAVCLASDRAENTASRNSSISWSHRCREKCLSCYCLATDNSFSLTCHSNKTQKNRNETEVLERRCLGKRSKKIGTKRKKWEEDIIRGWRRIGAKIVKERQRNNYGKQVIGKRKLSEKQTGKSKNERRTMKRIYVYGRNKETREKKKSGRKKRKRYNQGKKKNRVGEKEGRG
jgi:hypothetical protein